MPKGLTGGVTLCHMLKKEKYKWAQYYCMTVCVNIGIACIYV